MKKPLLSRRDYLKASVVGAAGAFFSPTILPAHVLGKRGVAPSDVLIVGQIGCGRIARGHDMPLVMQHAGVRMAAVCDLDSLRAAEGRALVEQTYRRLNVSAPTVRVYHDYRELLAQPDIDAVVISTPDHQHFLPTIEASLAGKDVYLQKPFSLTVREGRILSDVLHRMGTVFQIGSQQRSADPWPHFKRACELVRNGRIGELRTVRVGLPGDPPGGDATAMPVPASLDYDAWLGTTPEVYYTVDRVHPQERVPPARDYSRPGWLRCEQFSAGMITGWGAHHVDTAHWGMGTEFTGPIQIEAAAQFASGGLWDVHGDFRVEARYANGVTMLISGEFPNGVRFEGSEGWIFVTRGGGPVTSSDPAATAQDAPLQASSPAILSSEIGPNDLHLYASPEQHTNWIDCIRSRATTVAPVEVAHRSTSACLISHIAMKLQRPLRWDPINERFHGDDEANGMLSRPQRYPYNLESVTALRVGS